MQSLNVPASKEPLPMALGAWSLPELLKAIATRDATIEKQQREIEQLRERVEGQSEVLAKTQQALLEMRAKLTHARQEMFGASRERMSAWQLDIFDQAHETPLPPQQPDLSIPVQGHRRKRRSKGRPALPSDLPIERIVHPMPEQELSQYDRVTVIGETVTRTLKYTPAKMSVVEHVCPRHALVKNGVSTVRGFGRINDHPINRIEQLAPYNWKPSGVAGSASSVAPTSSLPVAGSGRARPTRH